MNLSDMAVLRLSIFMLLMRVFSVTADEDNAVKEVLEVRTACLYHRALSFSCPEDHIVVLRKAHYLVGESDGCNTEDTDVCQLENVISTWFTMCHRSHECELDVRAPNRTDDSCAGYQGDPFLEVTYKCEAHMGVFYETSVRDMCDFGSTFHGSLMYLWSKNYPHFSQDLDCGCRINVEPNIELRIVVPHFEVAEVEYDKVVSHGCVHALDIQAGHNKTTICSQDTDTLAVVDKEVADNVYIHYRNPHHYYTRLWIVLQVHYEHNFTMDCQRDFEMPPLPTQPVTTTYQHTTTTDSPHNSFQILEPHEKSHWPIITSVVAVVCVLLVIGITVLLFCRTRLRDKIMRQKGIVETENFRFDNSVYMNHAQVDRQSNRSSESGSQHQVSIIMAPSNRPNVSSTQSNLSHHSNSPLPPKRDSLPPIPDEAEPNGTQEPDIIPAAVLQRLGFQSETAPPTVGDIKGSETRKTDGKNATVDKEGQDSRNNSVSVKDRAKL